MPLHDGQRTHQEKLVANSARGYEQRCREQSPHGVCLVLAGERHEADGAKLSRNDLALFGFLEQ